jgi:hypothetical protein
MLLDDLNGYLVAGNVGSTSIFSGWMPFSPDTAVVIHETGGLPSVHTMSTGPGHPAVEQPRVQVVVRAPAYEDARIIMHRVHARMDGAKDLTLNGILYHWIDAVQAPFFLRQDENNRIELACNYQIIKDVSTT